MHSGVKLLLLTGFLAGCATAVKKKSNDNAGTPVDKPFQFWVHDNDLIEIAQHSAQRIINATGLPLLVNAPGTITSSIPIFWTDQLCADNYGGFFVESSCGGFIMVSRDCHPVLTNTVLTHEMIHSLGVLGHLPV